MLKDGFDSLDEDFDEEQFFAAVRAGYWRAGRWLRGAHACRDAHSEARVLTPGTGLMDYKASGVDIDAGNEAVRRIRGLARSTFTPNVLSDIGSFGGLFRFTTGSFRIPCSSPALTASERS